MKNFIISLFTGIFSICAANAQGIVAAEYFKKSITENRSVQLLDVRTDAEFSQSHLKNALQINVMEKNFVKRCEESLNKEEPVYVYCKSGGRSNRATELLQKVGFKTIDLKGGITAWELAGYPLVTNAEN